MSSILAPPGATQGAWTAQASVTPRKDIEQVVRAAWRQGWRVEKTRNGHWKLYSPNGRDIVTASGTPSSHRSVDVTIATLRRHGFVWKGR